MSKNRVLIRLTQRLSRKLKKKLRLLLKRLLIPRRRSRISNQRKKRRLSPSQMLLLRFKLPRRWMLRPTPVLLSLLRPSRSQRMLARSKSSLLWKKLSKKLLKKLINKELPSLVEPHNLSLRHPLNLRLSSN